MLTSSKAPTARGWTNARLARLFEQYRRRYWATSRRLRRYRVQATTLKESLYGCCDRDTRVLLIDVSQHRSDRHIRATLLHEMVHAAVGRGGHDAPFWTQLEYLLSRCAPITVSFPELGERGSHLGIIPPRFRRCRRLFRPIYERQQRAFKRMKLPSMTVTPKDIETECDEWASLDGAVWRELWPHLASIYGFVDLDGHVRPWAKPYRVAARRGYVRGRRFFLREERLRARPADRTVQNHQA